MSITIFVKGNFEHSPAQFLVKPEITTAELKKLISNKLDIPINNQRLTIFGQFLKNSDVISNRAYVINPPYYLDLTIIKTNLNISSKCSPKYLEEKKNVKSSHIKHNKHICSSPKHNKHINTNLPHKKYITSYSKTPDNIFINIDTQSGVRQVFLIDPISTFNSNNYVVVPIQMFINLYNKSDKKHKSQHKIVNKTRDEHEKRKKSHTQQKKNNKRYIPTHEELDRDLENYFLANRLTLNNICII